MNYFFCFYKNNRQIENFKLSHKSKQGWTKLNYFHKKKPLDKDNYWIKVIINHCIKINKPQFKIIKDELFRNNTNNLVNSIKIKVGVNSELEYLDITNMISN